MEKVDTFFYFVSKLRESGAIAKDIGSFIMCISACGFIFGFYLRTLD